MQNIEININQNATVAKWFSFKRYLTKAKTHSYNIQLVYINAY